MELPILRVEEHDGGIMEYVAEKANPSQCPLTISEALPLLWEWRRYRNEVFWITMYRWGGAALVLTIIPYVLPELIGKLGKATLVFPVLAFVLCMFGAWLMAALYIRFVSVNRKYRALLGDFDPNDEDHSRLILRVFGVSLGKVVVAFFVLFGLFMEALNLVVLASLVRSVGP